MQSEQISCIGYCFIFIKQKSALLQCNHNGLTVTPQIGKQQTCIHQRIAAVYPSAFLNLVAR